MTIPRTCVAVAAGLVICGGSALADEALARHYECHDCHGDAEDAIGPPFADIAARYASTPEARDALITVVKHGGKGNWTEVTGGVPMPPYYADMSDAEIAQVVDWILSR